MDPSSSSNSQQQQQQPPSTSSTSDNTVLTGFGSLPWIVSNQNSSRRSAERQASSHSNDSNNLPSFIVHDNPKPAEFISRKLFNDFTILAGKKIDNILSQDPIEKALSKSLQRGEDANFDQMLVALGSISEHCLPSLLRALIAWYHHQLNLDDFIQKNNNSNSSPTAFQQARNDLKDLNQSSTTTSRDNFCQLHQQQDCQQPECILYNNDNNQASNCSTLRSQSSSSHHHQDTCPPSNINTSGGSSSGGSNGNQTIISFLTTSTTTTTSTTLSTTAASISRHSSFLVNSLTSSVASQAPASGAVISALIGQQTGASMITSNSGLGSVGDHSGTSLFSSSSIDHQSKASQMILDSNNHSTIDANLLKKRELAIEFIFCQALIEIFGQLSLHPGHEDLINHIELIAFQHFKFREGEQNEPNITNIHMIADLYGEVIGVLAQTRFQSVRKKFMYEMKELRSKELTTFTMQSIISLLMGMKFFRVKMAPIEEFEASFQFLQECANYFLEVRHKDIKHALAGLFVEILVPVAATVKNEVNVPCLKKFVDMLYPQTLDMCTKKKHALSLFPLVTCLLCVSQRSFFLANWHIFLSMCLSNLKNRDQKMCRVALESLYRLLWVYMIRIKCESNTLTQSRLHSIVNSLFPKGSKNVVPRDSPLNIFVKIIQFIAQERLDFAMKQIVFDLLSVERPIKIILTPERMNIALRAFLVVADSLQQREGEPPMPRSVGVLPSGNTSRVRKTYLQKMLTEETAKSIGIYQYYPHVRRSFNDILKALDIHFGRPLLLTTTHNMNKEPDDMISGERKPKIDLFKTCVAAIPRLMPEGMSKQDLIDLLSRLTVHMDEEMRGYAYQSLQTLVADLNDWRADVVERFTMFLTNDINDTLRPLVDNALRMLLQLLTNWKTAITVTSSTQSSSQRNGSTDSGDQQQQQPCRHGGGQLAARKNKALCEMKILEKEVSVSKLDRFFSVFQTVEGFALVMLCSCRQPTRKLAAHILRECRLLNKHYNTMAVAAAAAGDASMVNMLQQRLLANASGRQSVDEPVADVIDRVAATAAGLCLPYLSASERQIIMTSTVVDLQLLAERSGSCWTSATHSDSESSGVGSGQSSGQQRLTSDTPNDWSVLIGQQPGPHGLPSPCGNSDNKQQHVNAWLAFMLAYADHVATSCPSTTIIAWSMVCKRLNSLFAHLEPTQVSDNRASSLLSRGSTSSLKRPSNVQQHSDTYTLYLDLWNSYLMFACRIAPPSVSTTLPSHQAPVTSVTNHPAGTVTGAAGNITPGPMTRTITQANNLVSLNVCGDITSTTAPGTSNLSSSPDHSSTDRSDTKSPQTRLIMASAMFKQALTLFRSEQVDVTNATINGLAQVNENILKDLMDELTPYIREAIDRKQENMRRRKRREMLRVHLGRLFELISEKGIFGNCSTLSQLDRDSSCLSNDTLVEYVDGMRLYLETESDKDTTQLAQTIKIYFSKFIHHFINSFSLDLRSSLFNRDLRKNLFHLFVNWIPGYGDCFSKQLLSTSSQGGASEHNCNFDYHLHNVANKSSKSTSTQSNHNDASMNNDFEVAALQAISSVLCCGSVFDERILAEDSCIYPWLVHLMSSKTKELQDLGLETAILLLEYNPDVGNLLDWLVDCCYTKNEQIADLCFTALATIFSVRDHPCDRYIAIINVTLMNIGCLRSNIHHLAMDLMRLLDERFLIPNAQQFFTMCADETDDLHLNNNEAAACSRQDDVKYGANVHIPNTHQQDTLDIDLQLHGGEDEELLLLDNQASREEDEDDDHNRLSDDGDDLPSDDRQTSSSFIYNRSHPDRMTIDISRAAGATQVKQRIGFPARPLLFKHIANDDNSCSQSYNNINRRQSSTKQPSVTIYRRLSEPKLASYGYHHKQSDDDQVIDGDNNHRDIPIDSIKTNFIGQLKEDPSMIGLRSSTSYHERICLPLLPDFPAGQQNSQNGQWCSQSDVSRRMARLHPQLTMPMISEITYRVQTATPSMCQNLLISFLPWLTNMELVDHNLAPSTIPPIANSPMVSNNVATCGSAAATNCHRDDNLQHQTGEEKIGIRIGGVGGEESNDIDHDEEYEGRHDSNSITIGWGSSEATQMVLNNFFHLVIKLSNQYPKEIEAIWAKMSTSMPNNMRIIIRFLFVMITLAPNELCEHVKRVALFMARANIDKFIDEIMNEMQTVETINGLVESTQAPPFYRLTNLRKLYEDNIDEDIMMDILDTEFNYKMGAAGAGSGGEAVSCSGDNNASNIAQGSSAADSTNTTGSGYHQSVVRPRTTTQPLEQGTIHTKRHSTEANMMGFHASLERNANTYNTKRDYHGHHNQLAGNQSSGSQSVRNSLLLRANNYGNHNQQQQQMHTTSGIISSNCTNLANDASIAINNWAGLMMNNHNQQQYQQNYSTNKFPNTTSFDDTPPPQDTPVDGMDQPDLSGARPQSPNDASIYAHHHTLHQNIYPSDRINRMDNNHEYNISSDQHSSLMRHRHKVREANKVRGMDKIHKQHRQISQLSDNDSTHHKMSNVPQPYPLPMPEFGGFYAPLNDFLPPQAQPIVGLHRCSLALVLMSGVIGKSGVILDWTAHLPTMLHVCFLGLDHLKPFVHENCKQLLVDLLTLLSRQSHILSPHHTLGSTDGGLHQSTQPRVYSYVRQLGLDKLLCKPCKMNDVTGDDTKRLNSYSVASCPLVDYSTDLDQDVSPSSATLPSRSFLSHQNTATSTITTSTSTSTSASTKPPNEQVVGNHHLGHANQSDLEIGATTFVAEPSFSLSKQLRQATKSNEFDNVKDVDIAKPDSTGHQQQQQVPDTTVDVSALSDVTTICANLTNTTSHTDKSFDHTLRSPLSPQLDSTSKMTNTDNMPECDHCDEANHALMLIIDMLLKKDGILWPNEDVTAKIWNIKSTEQMNCYINEVLYHFHHRLPQAKLRERWAEVSLQCALSCSSRHYAGRSLQIFRALKISPSPRMMTDILSRLVETVSEQGEDMQGYVTELMLTLEAIVDILGHSNIGDMPNANKTTDSHYGRQQLNCTTVNTTKNHHLLFMKPGVVSPGKTSNDDHCNGLDDDDTMDLGDYNFNNYRTNEANCALFFWIAVVMLETDYEHEFLLALKLLHKVLPLLPLDQSECIERIEKNLLQMRWDNFPGVNALVLKGCTSATTYETSIIVLNQLTPILDNLIIDVSESANSFPYNVMAQLTYLLLHYDEPNPTSVRISQQIAAWCTEKSKKLDNLSTVMTLYSRRTFSKESLQWIKCVVKYLYDAYSHVFPNLISFLIEMLDKGPQQVQQHIISIIYCILNYFDITSSGQPGINADLVKIANKYVEGPQWKEALRIFKLIVSRSSTLTTPSSSSSTLSQSLPPMCNYQHHQNQAHHFQAQPLTATGVGHNTVGGASTITSGFNSITSMISPTSFMADTVSLASNTSWSGYSEYDIASGSNLSSAASGGAIGGRRELPGRTMEFGLDIKSMPIVGSKYLIKKSSDCTNRSNQQVSTNSTNTNTNTNTNTITNSSTSNASSVTNATNATNTINTTSTTNINANINTNTGGRGAAREQSTNDKNNHTMLHILQEGLTSPRKSLSYNNSFNEPLAHHWRRPWLAQAHIRERLVSLLTGCGQRIGLPKSPSVIFSQNSDVVDQPSSKAGSSTDEVSPSQNDLSDHDKLEVDSCGEEERFTMFRDFDFLEYELESQDGDNQDNFNWGVRRLSLSRIGDTPDEITITSDTATCCPDSLANENDERSESP